MIRSWKEMKPKVDPTAFISEAAYVLGEVEIGSNSSIWPGVVIRGDSGKIKIGINTGILYLNIYPKKDGISTPSCSAIALTIKFGPLPM